MSGAPSSYDDVPYDSHSFPQSHPDQLAVLAKLFGMDPPPVEHCRVLEIGCASGGNLQGMAQNLPDSRFVGVDNSARQIEQGQMLIERLGVTNIELKHMDLADVGPEFGTFDYIVTHGVFSWVPARLRDKILQICKTNLAPNGVAYISYNTYPGWHIRGIVRDMMRFHGRQFRDAPTQVAQAKALVEFVANALPAENNPYIQLLKSELAFLSKADAFYLYHDHLEDENQPLYFHEFAQQLSAHGLQYLAESEFATMIASNFTPGIAETLNRLGAHDIVQMDQYMDFVRNRMFRQTLVCHNDVVLRRNLGPQDVRSFWFSSPAKPVRESVSLAMGIPEEFALPNGVKATITGSVCKAAFVLLSRCWPSEIAFADLVRRVGSLCEQETRETHATEAVENQLGADLLTCLASGLIECRLRGLRVAHTVEKHPRATRLARLQASEGRSLTNLRGQNLQLDDLGRLTLANLDGERDRTELVKALQESIQTSGLTVRQNGQPVTDTAQLTAILEGSIDEILRTLARHAFLQA